MSIVRVGPVAPVSACPVPSDSSAVPYRVGPPTGAFGSVSSPGYWLDTHVVPVDPRVNGGPPYASATLLGLSPMLTWSVSHAWDGFHSLTLNVPDPVGDGAPPRLE